MAVFKAFKPSGMEKIARSMGYQGQMNGFENYLATNPMKQQEMNRFTMRAQQMAKGGVIKMQEGGKATIGQTTAERMQDPKLTEGQTVVPYGVTQDPSQTIDQGTGQVSGTINVDPALANTTLANQPADMNANLMNASTSSDQVNTALDAVNAAQTDPNNPNAKVLAAQQTESSVGNLDAAQGKYIKLDNPMQRELQDGELIEPTFNAEKAAKFSEQIQAAEATPTEKATVQGQLSDLMTQFEGGNTPPWASGAMRAVAEQMSARGLSSSSIAGQALIQAAMESALPVAMADASTFAKFESQNLSNRQQRAMLAAEQRANFIGQEFNQAFQARVMNATKISDIANMNFTTEQQIALENSRAANSMNLANLSNAQALVMAEAAALSQLDMANLSNRQQASVMNAQSFLQMEMANLSNQQQTNMFKAQQRIQALFTDQAAENAARQFNAASQNQVDQFFANLSTQVSQFNATQANAQSQFNAGQVNTVERFNAELNNQRDQFNAQNQLVIAQSNAQWRRTIATADTAALNRANELNASALLDMSKQAYDNLWQYYADSMEWAWTSAESELDRINKLAVSNISADAMAKSAEMEADAKAASGLGSLIGSILGASANSVVGKMFF
tara:strand:- start:5772 stop:7634 length:1863 start_codon:yes stop_codon:yes gene_type:complete